jgi:hypothetical protein
MQAPEWILSGGVFALVLWLLAMKRGKIKLEVNFTGKDDDN